MVMTSVEEIACICNKSMMDLEEFCGPSSPSCSSSLSFQQHEKVQDMQTINNAIQLSISFTIELMEKMWLVNSP